MGILDFWKSRKRRAFVTRVEALAGSIQMEMYEYTRNALAGRIELEQAKSVAACIANFVFRFGDVNPEHQASGIKKASESERIEVFGSLGVTFKTNATGVLILLGAAWGVEMPKFKAHLSLLASEGFVMVGSAMPNVSKELSGDDLVYFQEAVNLNSAGA